MAAAGEPRPLGRQENMVHLTTATALVAALLSSTTVAQSTTQVPQSAEELVQALAQFPAALPGGAPSDGVPSATERLRGEIYDRLWYLGAAALPALCRGLGDPNVQVRRNVALFLGVASGDWYERDRPHLEITDCTPALVEALNDRDSRVRELAAEAVGEIGAEGVSAVPALIGMLGSAREGDRNTACIALAGIGPAAKEALPALEKALSDPSTNVQRFAKRAIQRIRR